MNDAKTAQPRNRRRNCLQCRKIFDTCSAVHLFCSSGCAAAARSGRPAAKRTMAHGAASEERSQRVLAVGVPTDTPEAAAALPPAAWRLARQIVLCRDAAQRQLLYRVAAGQALDAAAAAVGVTPARGSELLASAAAMERVAVAHARARGERVPGEPPEQDR